MTTTTACPDCHAPFEPLDNYCRQCGMYLAALREVAVAPQGATVPERYERQRATLPAPVKKAVTAVAIGTALQVGMSLTGRYLARQAARQAAGALRPRAKAQRTAERTARTGADGEVERRDDGYADAAAVSETVIIRRVWIRRP